MFDDQLKAGPLAHSVGERRALLREANLATVKQVRDGCARRWASTDPEIQVRSFVCECGDARCQSDVDATVAVVAGGPVLAGDHR